MNLAGALEEEGFRVLCIDMDPQANLTAGLGINLNTVERSMADVLADGRATLADVVLPTDRAGIDHAPGTSDLARCARRPGRWLPLRPDRSPAEPGPADGQWPGRGEQRDHPGPDPVLRDE